MSDNIFTKPEAIIEAIRRTDVGNDIIIQNSDLSIWCILKVICKEHPEDLSDDGGEVKNIPRV